MTKLSAGAYCVRYGATTGDHVRLADTDLWVRVGDDRTARGDEPVRGYAKNPRSRMAQSDAATGPSELDVVLTGALVIDPVIGVVKADIGIKDGRIAGIGSAGSPEISDGIDLVIGPHTKSCMAYGLIATPGAVDTHVHTISPELLPPAPAGGETTLITADRVAPARRLGTRRTLVPVSGVRGLTRASLHANRAVAPVDIDLRTGAVSLDGRVLAVDPVAEVPLSRRYLLR